MGESWTVAAPSQLLECADQNGIVAEDASTLSSADGEERSHGRRPRQQIELFPLVGVKGGVGGASMTNSGPGAPTFGMANMLGRAVEFMAGCYRTIDGGRGGWPWECQATFPLMSKKTWKTVGYSSATSCRNMKE